VREGPLLREWHLREDAGPRGPLVEAVARPQPLELLAGVAVHDHQPVEPEVRPRLDEQGGVGHEQRGSPTRDVGGPTGLLGAHPGVDDGVQPHAGRGVREHERRKGGAVQRAVGAQHSGAEGAGDLLESRAARHGDVARDGVEVERLAAVAGEPPQDVGLAARDATGQAHPQQGLPR